MFVVKFSILIISPKINTFFFSEINGPNSKKISGVVNILGRTEVDGII